MKIILKKVTKNDFCINLFLSFVETKQNNYGANKSRKEKTSIGTKETIGRYLPTYLHGRNNRSRQIEKRIT